ncbi:hypothetical protein ACM26V_14860 [Salipaludibacillus sp. HK11]|uniref:hypothetical protein n=1 Tax=Salipaludibacillus sp. HK11 TaxID=3394320 RepID=UPI0039FD83A3
MKKPLIIIVVSLIAIVILIAYGGLEDNTETESVPDEEPTEVNVDEENSLDEAEFARAEQGMIQFYDAIASSDREVIDDFVEEYVGNDMSDMIIAGWQEYTDERRAEIETDVTIIDSIEIEEYRDYENAIAVLADIDNELGEGEREAIIIFVEQNGRYILLTELDSYNAEGNFEEVRELF